jgi:predicted nuclease of predicted toxin-antitoxin system
MRFLANENFPGSAVSSLRSLGHDVVWVRIASPGASDPDVLERAVSEKRILLAFDKNFGEPAQASRLPPECGIVLLRMPMPRASEAGDRLAALIHRRSDWAAHFSVIEPGRLRMRPIRL